MASPLQPRPENRPLLGIDTSSSQAGLVLYDGLAVATRSWPSERTHTTTLLGEIHQLLARSDITVRDIAAVAIATGPGAFTALRVGLGVAKGFHLATGVPLLGVSTLEVTALAFATCGTPIVAVVGAGRGRLVWARYEGGASGLAEVRAPRNGTVSELADELNGSGPLLLTGEIDQDHAELFRRLGGVSVPSATLRMRHPGALAELAWRRWQAGDVDSAEAIEPIYLAR